ncbi:DUF4388 domain-containing protein [Acidobacteriota bacterium]
MPKSIMIADSEQWSIELISGLAREMGYEIVVAKNGIEALERFMNYAPEMVFVDNLLEKLDGFQVARKIRGTELGRVTPIVLLSAIYQEGAEISDLIDRYYFNEFLPKPFDEDKIRGILSSYLAEKTEVKVAEPGLQTDRPDAPTTIEGDLANTAIADILFDLYQQAKTGMLYVTAGEITKVLYIDQGNISFARSNSSRHRLGSLLLKARLITQEHFERATQIQTLDKGRTRLGMILVSMGALSEEMLKAAVHSQILSIIFSLFETHSGPYYFIETVKTPEEHLPLDMNTMDVLMWGVRKMDDSVDFKAYLPEPGLCVTKAAGTEHIEREVSLTYFERQILSFIDGKKTVGEIVSIGHLAQIPVYRILYSLFKIGVIETKPNEAPEEGEKAVLKDQITRETVIPRRGRLLSISTVRLLSRLYFSGRSGVLQVQKNGQTKSLFLRDGRILYARSNQRQDRLGYLLLSSGKVTRNEYERAIEMRSHSPSTRIGTLFVEMGAISLDDLHWTVKFQILRILKSIFAMEDAEYSFSEGSIPSEEMIVLDHSTPDLIMDCVRSMPATAQVRVHQPLMSSLVLKAMDDNQIRRIITVTPSEEKLLAYLGPGKTMNKLREIDFMDQEEMEKVIYGFNGLGILKSITGADKTEEAQIVREEAMAYQVESAPPSESPSVHQDNVRDTKDDSCINSKMEIMEQELERLRRINEQLNKRLNDKNGEESLAIINTAPN